MLLTLTLIAKTILVPEPVSANQAIAETGSILETMNASGYTYMKVQTTIEEAWVAIPETEVKVGENVTFLEGMVMKDFHSKTLGRTFDTIIFSSGLVKGHTQPLKTETPKPKSSGSSFADAVKQESGQTIQQQQPGSTGSAGAIVPYLETKVEKADGENAITVEDAFKKAAELNGSVVRIRGKVVKFSPNIMGRNWIHIQDGTGSPMENSHDLVVTTNDIIDVDEIVLLEGKIAADKDFGHGYKYSALIEEASIQK